jgi:hypothetical protein
VSLAPLRHKVTVVVLLQRKVLTPAAAPSLGELAARILGFEAEYRLRPFCWRFTRADFERRLQELAA